jgi:hypothetical protein
MRRAERSDTVELGRRKRDSMVEEFLLGRHEENGKDFIDTSKTARVDLADVDSLGLEELLEDHSVVAGGGRIRKRKDQFRINKTKKVERGGRRTRALQWRLQYREASGPFGSERDQRCHRGRWAMRQSQVKVSESLTGEKGEE